MVNCSDLFGNSQAVWTLQAILECSPGDPMGGLTAIGTFAVMTAAALLVGFVVAHVLTPHTSREPEILSGFMLLLLGIIAFRLGFDLAYLGVFSMIGVWLRRNLAHLTP